MAICKHCGEQIEYRTTAAGKSIPVDPHMVAVLTRRGTVVHGWTVHFTTCRDGHRRLPAELRIIQELFRFKGGNGH